METSYSPLCVFFLDSTSHIKGQFHQASPFVEATSLDMFRDKNTLSPLIAVLSRGQLNYLQTSQMGDCLQWQHRRETRQINAMQFSILMYHKYRVGGKSTSWNNSPANLHLIISATTRIASRNATQQNNTEYNLHCDQRCSATKDFFPIGFT